MFGGDGKGKEERDGREFFGAFDAGWDVRDIVGEGEVNNGGFGIGERVSYEGSVGRGGEEGDRDIAVKEETG